MTEEGARDAVRRLVAEHPEYNQSDIARLLGISRERVRQIVLSESLSVQRYRRGVGMTVPAPRVITGGLSVPISSTVAGTIAELLVAADLMARGFTVFFPLTRTGACDIVTVDAIGHAERIEVRCGVRADNGFVRFAKPDASKSDRRAIVITGEPVLYDPPMNGDAKGPRKARNDR